MYRYSCGHYGAVGQRDYTCDGKINHDENREKSVLSALVVAAKMIQASEPSPPKTIIMEPHSDYPQAPTKL